MLAVYMADQTVRNGLSVTPYGTPYCGLDAVRVPVPLASSSAIHRVAWTRGVRFGKQTALIGLAIATSRFG